MAIWYVLLERVAIVNGNRVTEAVVSRFQGCILVGLFI